MINPSHNKNSTTNLNTILNQKYSKIDILMQINYNIKKISKSI